MEPVPDQWSPPEFDVTRSPLLQSTMQVQLDKNSDNFARAAKWCPDGSMFLTQCENRTLQFFNTPTLVPHLEVGETGVSFYEPAHRDPELSNGYDLGSGPSRVLQQPSPILDFIWYPTASVMDPASFCFLASVRECPVKLLDASDGRLRASYSIVDHRERQIAPHSLAFNLTAERLYCGFEDAVEVFDVNRPGDGTRLPTTPSKKSKDGLKGIVSALSFVPSQGSDMYAAGSLTPIDSNIAMFSEAHGPEPIMFISGGPHSGVTQIHFNFLRPHIMYAAFRRHGAIYSWDIRHWVDRPLEIFQLQGHEGRTNQKLRFDVDLGGRWLATGDQHGNISMFDLSSPDDDTQSNRHESFEAARPILEFDAHSDAIGSVSFHPLQSILLSTSGSRHFEIDDESISSGTSGSEGEAVKKGVESGFLRNLRRKSRTHPIILDSSIKAWSLTSQTNETSIGI